VIIVFIIILATLFTLGLLICESSVKQAIQRRSCSNCEYDLTGLPPQTERCPECGCWFKSIPSRRVQPGGYHRRRLLGGIVLLMTFVVLLALMFIVPPIAAGWSW
jgi:hypothetical protein